MISKDWTKRCDAMITLLRILEIPASKIGCLKFSLFHLIPADKLASTLKLVNFRVLLAASFVSLTISLVDSDLIYVIDKLGVNLNERNTGHELQSIYKLSWPVTGIALHFFISYKKLRH
jgi:hypothetical protein